MPFVKEDPKINRKGRPAGTLSFDTLWKRAIKRIAKDDPSIAKEVRDLDIALIKTAIKEAQTGNYQFYKDIYDRRLGKAKESLDVTSQGAKVEGITFEVISKKDETETEDKQGAAETTGSLEQPEGQNLPT